MTPDELAHAYATTLAEVAPHVHSVYANADGRTMIRYLCFDEATGPCGECVSATVRATHLIEPGVHEDLQPAHTPDLPGPDWRLVSA